MGLPIAIGVAPFEISIEQAGEDVRRDLTSAGPVPFVRDGEGVEAQALHGLVAFAH